MLEIEESNLIIDEFEPLTEEELELIRRIWETREVIDFPSLGGG